jgi:hypothetical protein
MEIPFPKWMEFVIVALSLTVAIISIFIVDRFQKPQND